MPAVNPSVSAELAESLAARIATATRENRSGITAAITQMSTHDM